MKTVPLRRQFKLYEKIRRDRIAVLIASGSIQKPEDVPSDAIPASMELQARHNSYSPKLFYVDQPFCCVDCKSDEVWTAEQQMRWHEVLKGTIYTIPKRCNKCRKLVAQKTAIQRERSLAGAAKKTQSIRNENHRAEPGATANEHACHESCSEQHASRQACSSLSLNVRQI
jgi:hypothetical protein